MHFTDFDLHPEIIRSITELNYQRPTEIQAKAIPLLLKDSSLDFVGQAQTGTGKTAAFVIPLLEKIDRNDDNVQALVLAPTRELALQVENEIAKLSKYWPVKSLCVYGGTPYDKQITSLKREFPQVVVGTPGRVIDLIKRRILNISNTKLCVLDEADEMLNMGFYEDVQIILDQLSAERQLIMFSATLPEPIIKLLDRSEREYKLVKVKKESLSNEDIDQQYFVVKPKHFKEALARIIDMNSEMYGIVFCNTKIQTKEVGDELKERGYQVEVLHGDMGQAERQHAMKKFKDREVNILVCTDVAARGIDVANLTHVFNYGLPQDCESYVHRIGRTGRAGSKGVAYTLTGAKNIYGIKKIEKHINKKILRGNLPDVESLKLKVVEKEMASAEQILTAIQSKGQEFKVDAAYRTFSEHFAGLEHDELLKLMFTWKFNRQLRHYNNLPDIEDSFSAPDRKNSRSRRSGGGRTGGRSDRRGGNRSESRGGNRSESRGGNRSESRGERKAGGRSSESRFGNRDRDESRPSRSRKPRPRHRT